MQEACAIRYLRAVFCGIVTLFTALSDARADSVLLRTGEVISGTIVKDESDEVHIQIQGGGTTEIRVIAREHVHSVFVRTTLPPTSPAKSKTEPSLAESEIPSGGNLQEDSASGVEVLSTVASKVSRPQPTRYLRLDLHGSFGSDFDGWAVQEVIDQAKRHKIRHILIGIDSPGGFVYVGDDIARRIREAPEEIEFSCLIRNAISASIWVVIECNHVFFEDGSAMGAAVTYTRSASTGDVSVDAKGNAAIAAMLEAACERTKTWPAPVARAMVVQEAELWITTHNISKRITLSSDAIQQDSRRVDDSESVLALSGTTAVDWGLGKWWSTRTIFMPDWKLHSKIGEMAVRRSATRLADIANAEEAVKRLPELRARVDSNPHPSRFNDYTYVTTTYWTKYGWRESTDMSAVSVGIWRDRQSRFCEARRTLLHVAHGAFERLKRHDDEHLGERGVAAKEILGQFGNEVFDDWKDDCR